NASRPPAALQSTLQSGISHIEQVHDPVQPPDQGSQPQPTADTGNTHDSTPISAERSVSPRRDDSWLPQRTTAPSEPPEGQTLDPHQSRRLPHLRVVGQVAQSYIVTEGEDGSMYLIDQHAAHERILLERMVAAMKSRQSISQLLLTPINLKLA